MRNVILAGVLALGAAAVVTQAEGRAFSKAQTQSLVATVGGGPAILPYPDCEPCGVARVKK